MDIIKLLPDHIANQIAAGEVVQRPASVVKELVENSIDSGSSSIKVIIKDAGRTLVQLIDNGCGMSETDARLCFERHATSKIREAHDLFSIRTMGFRGEALASIAAVAQVELKTKRKEDELGTLVRIEGSTVIEQAPCQCQDGTSIAVKNLFYNIPARRNFLKTDKVELSHILNEFTRQALIHYNVSMEFISEQSIVYNLPLANFQQRIIAVAGSHLRNKLLPVEEETEYLKVSGFVAKPESSRKSRDEQYFFVNKRFIKSPYLQHAVQQVFNEFIPSGYYPSFYLNLTIDPKHLDVNIHPTKTEVKFDDEKLVYGVLNAAVKKSLGKNILVPTFDFDAENAFDVPPITKDTVIKTPQISINPDYNPFHSSAEQKKPIHAQRDVSGISHDKQFQHLIDIENTKQNTVFSSAVGNDENVGKMVATSFSVIHNQYIVSSVKSGMMLLDRKAACERIFYEELLERFSKQKPSAQGLLFPLTLPLAENSFQFVLQIKDELRLLGFDIENFGKNTIVVHAVPSGIPESDIQEIITDIILHYQSDYGHGADSLAQKTAMSIAVRQSAHVNEPLQVEEIKSLIDRLFSCNMPNTSPSGNPCFTILNMEFLKQIIKKGNI